MVKDTEPGEELLLFMKTEDYSHETMAPDIHGQQFLMALWYHCPQGGGGDRGW